YNVEMEARQMVKIVNQVVSQQLLFDPTWSYIKLNDILNSDSTQDKIEANMT
ncbi:33696_t:CDS:2, partial [Gigaspora margarita]